MGVKSKLFQYQCFSYGYEETVFRSIEDVKYGIAPRHSMWMNGILIYVPVYIRLKYSGLLFTRSEALPSFNNSLDNTFGIEHTPYVHPIVQKAVFPLISSEFILMMFVIFHFECFIIIICCISIN